jgi:hypothetical protein
MRNKILPALLGLSLLLSCKAVRSGKNDTDQSLGNSPRVESADGNTAATPPAVVPTTNNPVTPGTPDGSGGRIVNIPEPTAPLPVPGLTKPEAVKVFAIRSLPIEQNGQTATQYRVDLNAKTVKLDKVNGDNWQESKAYSLTEDQLQKMNDLLAGLKVGTYPSCNTCKREGLTLMLEAQENNAKAISYAMSEACTCGGNDERKSTLSFASLKQMTEILNK